MIEPAIIIDKPGNFSIKVLNDVISLIVLGGQIKAPDAKVGIHRSALLAVLQIDGQVVATACFKNPRQSYRERVFTEAMVPDLVVDYLHELGYIVTRPGFEGNGYCQRLLGMLMPHIVDQKLFATTRKAEMAHILEKLGFSQNGEVYKKDLRLLLHPARV